MIPHTEFIPSNRRPGKTTMYNKMINALPKEAIIELMDKYRAALSKWDSEILRDGSASASEAIVTHVRREYTRLCREHPYLALAARKSLIMRPRADKHLSVKCTNDFAMCNRAFMTGEAKQYVSIYPVSSPANLVCITYVRTDDQYVRLNISTYGDGRTGLDVSGNYQSNTDIEMYAKELGLINPSSSYVECFFYAEPESNKLHFLYATPANPTESNICTEELQKVYYSIPKSESTSFRRVVTKGKSEITTILHRNKCPAYIINFESNGIHCTLIPNWDSKHQLFTVRSTKDIVDAKGVVFRELFLVSVSPYAGTGKLPEVLTRQISFNELQKYPIQSGDLVSINNTAATSVILATPRTAPIDPPKTCCSCDSEVIEDKGKYMCTNRNRCPETNIRRTVEFFSNFGMDELSLLNAKILYDVGLWSVTDYLALTNILTLTGAMSHMEALSFIRKMAYFKKPGISYEKFIRAYAYVSVDSFGYGNIPLLYETFQNFIDNIEVSKHGLSSSGLDSTRRERDRVIADPSVYSAMMGVASVIVIN